MLHPKPLNTSQQIKEKTSRMSLCTIKSVILTGKPLSAALKCVTLFTQIYHFHPNP